MENAHFSNQIQGYQPAPAEPSFFIRKPGNNNNYHPPNSSDMFGFNVGPSNTGYGSSNVANYGSSMNTNAALGEHHQQPEPYVSIEGRKKRRRIEDAFENLSLRQQQQPNSTSTPDDHARGATGELHHIHRVTERKGQSDSTILTQTLFRNDEMISEGAERRTHAVTPLTISKKLFTDTMDADLNLQLGSNDDAPYSLSSNLSHLPDDFKLMKDDPPFSTTKYSQLQDEDDDDDANNSCSSSSACSTPEQKTASRSPHHPLPDTLFAPRKTRAGAPRGTPAVNTIPTDPVDARIEELIRHTRIRAMVKASIVVEREANGMDRCMNRNHTDDFMMRLKNQQDEEKQMDCGGVFGKAGGGLRRKNNGDDMIRRQKRMEHVMRVTRDDFDVKEYRRSSVHGIQPTKMDIQYGQEEHERGRSKNTHHNQRSPQDAASTRGCVTTQRRSKSLPKYSDFVSGCNYRDDTEPSEDAMALSS